MSIYYCYFNRWKLVLKFSFIPTSFKFYLKLFMLVLCCMQYTICVSCHGRNLNYVGKRTCQN